MERQKKEAADLLRRQEQEERMKKLQERGDGDADEFGSQMDDDEDGSGHTGS